jgi:hypothetical protein
MTLNKGTAKIRAKIHAKGLRFPFFSIPFTVPWCKYDLSLYALPHLPLSVLCHPSSVIRHLFSFFYSLSSVICPLFLYSAFRIPTSALKILCHPFSVLCHPSSIICRPSSVICFSAGRGFWPSSTRFPWDAYPHPRFLIF